MWSKFDFRIGSFSDAEDKYNNVTPIRGKDIRPLGDRRKQQNEIIKINDDTYACRLYNTDVATYHRDGRVVLYKGGWDTQTTNAFLCQVLPYGWLYHRENNKSHLRYSGTDTWFVMGNMQLTIDTNTNKVSGHLIPTKNLVNREASKIKRARFKPFLTWANSYMNVLGFEVPRIGWGEATVSMHEFNQEPENYGEDKYIEILSHFVHQRYYGLTFEQIKDQIHRENTVYETINLPIGSLQGR